VLQAPASSQHSAEAAASSTEIGLTPFRGSRKQVEWVEAPLSLEGVVGFVSNARAAPVFGAIHAGDTHGNVGPTSRTQSSTELTAAPVLPSSRVRAGA
jgi:hypothetical protein